MTTFISTELNKYLTSDNNLNIIPIYSVSKAAFEKWLTTLSSSQKTWVNENSFKASNGEVIKLFGEAGEVNSIIMGLGGENDSSFSGINLIAKLAKSLPKGHYQLVDDPNEKLSSIGWALAQYNFDRYQAKKNQNAAVLVLKAPELLKEISAIVTGSYLIRDLINTPTCNMGPSHLSEVMKELSGNYNGQFSEIVGDNLLQQNFNTIHAVGRAALNQPRLLEMTWGREDAPKLTLVGKGVCFDTGGLDIKPSSGMRIMKKDMGGAAHTLGLAQIIMATGLDVRLRLLIPAVENNISGDAFRPGDIIKTYKGTTVEVDNTDAEGRLVLCDALALASEENPELLINFATLTGAARVAMGTDVVPFFTDNKTIAAGLLEHSEQENDPVWQLPLYSPYESQLKSSVADLSNMGKGPFGGAITAALFLKHFVEEPNNWVHFDMYAWNMSESATCPEGGEAMAIRAVYAYLKERFS